MKNPDKNLSTSGKIPKLNQHGLLPVIEKLFLNCIKIQRHLLMLKKETLKFLCCPGCKCELKTIFSSDNAGKTEEELFCPVCRAKYHSTESYIDFLGNRNLVHSSKREKIIRSFYARIYTPATNFMFLFCGGVNSARREVLSRLNLQDNSVVLETGIGPGDNFRWMNSKAKNLVFFGIDIQKQMMIHSMRNLRKWKIEADLFRADAEELPFRDDMFDVVFHLGAINLFSDKKKAIDEMIRVAKPGTSIVIADETEKAGRLFNILTGGNEKIIPPVDLIPSQMQDISMDIIWRGYGYVIRFTKPKRQEKGPM